MSKYVLQQPTYKALTEKNLKTLEFDSLEKAENYKNKLIKTLETHISTNKDLSKLKFLNEQLEDAKKIEIVMV